MFFRCNSLETIDLSSFDSTALEDTDNYQEVFSLDYTSKLKTIYASSKFDMSDKAVESYMFSNCNNLVGEKGTSYKDMGSYVQTFSKYARLDDPDNDKPGYFTLK